MQRAAAEGPDRDLYQWICSEVHWLDAKIRIHVSNDNGRNPEETHTGMRRTCTLHKERPCPALGFSRMIRFTAKRIITTSPDLKLLTSAPLTLFYIPFYSTDWISKSSRVRRQQKRPYKGLRKCQANHSQTLPIRSEETQTQSCFRDVLVCMGSFPKDKFPLRFFLSKRSGKRNQGDVYCLEMGGGAISESLYSFILKSVSLSWKLTPVAVVQGKEKLLRAQSCGNGL